MRDHAALLDRVVSDVDIAFVFPSARSERANVGVFTPRAFAARQPDPNVQTWHCTAARDQVWFLRRAATEPGSVTFGAAAFRRDGALPRSG